MLDERDKHKAFFPNYEEASTVACGGMADQRRLSPKEWQTNVSRD
jgi:hypothetical protein